MTFRKFKKQEVRYTSGMEKESLDTVEGSITARKKEAVDSASVGALASLEIRKN
jgi:hypothetical protein